MSKIEITTFAKWQVKPEALDTVLELIAQATIASKKESGNLVYEAYQSTTEKNTIVLLERYENEEALNAHRSSIHFQEIVVGKIVPMLLNREVIVSTAIQS